jgi:hypothetical protein
MLNSFWVEVQVLGGCCFGLINAFIFDADWFSFIPGF